MLVQSLDQENPLEEVMATTSVFLPGKFHRHRSLEGKVAKSRTQLSD